jgi:hypothetical protein
MYHAIEVLLSGKNSTTFHFSPLNRKKEITNGFRLCGGSAFGSSTILRSDITETPIVNFVKNHCPNLLNVLKNGGSVDPFNRKSFTMQSMINGDAFKISVLTEDENEEIMVLSGDKELKDGQKYTATVTETDLFGYVKGYCSSDARKRILK